MNTKPTFVYSIRGKLISAIAMLLVAVIMVVSSTYAWFTLSTAPEVTGISTAIGANGALEIRLNTTLEDDLNGTFGNLVNLDKNALYGLDEITLLPSKLLLTGNMISSAYLGFPEYGADGRPKEPLLEKAVLGQYNGVSFVPLASDATDSNGVSAVGVASGLSDRQIAFRNAKTTAANNMSLAKTMARNSLQLNGPNLASLVMKKAADDNATYDQTELNYIKAIINDLLKNEGALYYIEESYEQLIVAYAGSQAINELVKTQSLDVTIADSIFTHVKTNIGTGELTLEKIAENDGIKITGIADYTDKTISIGNILTGVEAFVKTKASVVAANNDANAITDVSITWTQISGVFDKILTYNNMTINGYAPSEVKANIGSIVAAGIQLQMPTGTGVYADIADHCGNYTAAINVNVDYSGIKVDNLPASMVTQTTKVPLYLDAATTVVTDAKEPEGTGAQVLPMSEFYGYILDFVFRTNASGSNLLLQTEAADRIYSDNNNELTQGAGSFMSFKATDPSFKDQQVKDLMANIRIVFFDTKDKTVIAYAKLDTATATPDADGAIKANMYICETETTYTLKYKTTGAAEFTTETGIYVKEIPAAEVGRNPTYEYYTDKDLTTKVNIPEAATEISHDTPVVKDIFLKDKDAILKSLPQNQEVQVSTLVYLDGETLQNSHVAATVASSVTGKMNLQFASDANLVPMEYADLHIKGDGATTEYTVTFNENGGSGTMTAAKANGTYTLPPETTFTAPAGKVFAGWSTTADGEKLTDTTINVTADTTLYAVWTDESAG